MRTFFSSKQAIQYLQGKYGSADYSNLQSLRYTFYSYVLYGTAGASTYTFFGDALGTNSTNRQITNMPKAGSFGQLHFLLKQIRCKYFITDPEADSWDGTDAETLYSDFVNGLFQAGYFDFQIQAKSYVQFPKPFLYAGGGDGRDQLHTAGIEALTLSEGTPNVLDTYRSCSPHATLTTAKCNKYLVDPNILIEAEQNFSVNINYPSGALAPIATGIISATNFYIGVELDGIILRPVQ